VISASTSPAADIRSGRFAFGAFAKGDTVLGDGGKEFAEDVVDVGGGEEIAVDGGGNFIAQALGLEELQFLPGMEGAEGRMDRTAQHAAAAAVGKVKLTARGDTSAGILICHGSLLEMDLIKAKGEADRLEEADGEIRPDYRALRFEKAKK
jgi:hypothetical protein